MAIFSEVASQCMSTTMASAATPSGQASSWASTAEKGSSRLSMCTRPSTFMTSTRRPPGASNIHDPRPGAWLSLG